MTILPDTLQFLCDLSENNNRDWFLANKARYEAAHQNMLQFAGEVEKALGATDVLEGSKVFRIYRDVRFSKDKSPYKNNFGTGFTRATKLRRGSYYLHIEPGASFAGGGFWQPEPHDLKRIRDEFARDDRPIRQIMAHPDFIRYFGNFYGEALKTAPKGYDKASPALDLIRKKNFVVVRDFSDSEVTSEDFLSQTRLTFEAMRPFLDYMSEVLTTDLNGESIV